MIPGGKPPDKLPDGECAEPLTLIIESHRLRLFIRQPFLAFAMASRYTPPVPDASFRGPALIQFLIQRRTRILKASTTK
jgi:hypothetical protein